MIRPTLHVNEVECFKIYASLEYYIWLRGVPGGIAEYGFEMGFYGSECFVSSGVGIPDDEQRDW